MLFKYVLYALGLLTLIGGIAAVVISLPEQAWNAAMLRLSARLQLEARRPLDPPTAAVVQPVPAFPSGARGEVDRRSSSASKASMPEARSRLDHTLDLVIEVLRRMIGTRSFPRTALRVLGLILILAAVVCFVMGSLIKQGEADEEGLATHRVVMVAKMRPSVARSSSPHLPTVTLAENVRVCTPEPARRAGPWAA